MSLSDEGLKSRRTFVQEAKFRMARKLMWRFVFICVILLVGFGASSSARQIPVTIMIPSTIDPSDREFAIRYVDGKTYHCWIVFNEEVAVDTDAPRPEWGYQQAKYMNWLILDQDLKIVGDTELYTALAIGANAAFVSGGRFRHDVLLEDAELFDQARFIDAVEQLCNLWGYVGAKLIYILITKDASPPVSEGTRSVVREVLKEVGVEFLQEVANRLQQPGVVTEVAWRATLHAKLAECAAQMRSFANTDVIPPPSELWDYEKTLSYYKDVRHYREETGYPHYFALAVYLEQGLTDYIKSVVAGIDPGTGAAEKINEIIDQLSDHPTMAESLSCLASWHAVCQREDDGLVEGASAIQAAFLQTNRILDVSVLTQNTTYSSRQSIRLNVSVKEQDNVAIDVDSVSFSVKDSSDVTKLQGTCDRASTVGSYSVEFSAADLGATGEFTIEATALLNGYLEGRDSCHITITQGAFLSSDPASYDIDLARSAYHSDLITVSNTASAPTSISVDTSGEIDSWITPSETSFSLNGFSSRELHFTINVPSGATEGHNYSGAIVLSYDGESLNVPVLVRVTGQGDNLASSATIDGSFAPESPDRYNPYPIYIDNRDYYLRDEPYVESGRYENSFSLTTSEFDRLIKLENYAWIKKVFDAGGAHNLYFNFNGERIWRYADADPPLSWDITDEAIAGVNVYRYGIDFYVTDGEVEIEYLIDEHEFKGWFSKQAWGANRSYSQSTLDAWRAGWYYGKLEAQVSAVHQPGRLFFFLNGEPIAYRSVSTSDVGRTIYFPMFRDKAEVLSTSNRFSLKGCAQYGSSIDWGNHAIVNLGPIRFSVTYFSGQPDVRIHKMIEPVEVFVGDTATVTITLTNQGTNIACGAEFQDSLPSGLELISGSLTGRESLTPSESATFMYIVKAKKAQSYTLPAVQVSYENPLDEDFTSSSGSVPFLVKAYPELNLISGLNKSEYSEGETATLSVTVTDNGGAGIDGVNITSRIMSGADTIINVSFQTGSNGTGSDTFYVPTTPGSYTVEISASKTDYISDSNSIVFAVIDSLPPTVPTPLLPSQETYVNESTPQLTWMSSIDIGAGLSHYVVQIDVDQNFTSPIESIVNNTYYNPTSNLSDGTYYWRVKSVDTSQNESAWSEIFFFIVDTVPPTITIVDPADGQQSVAVDTKIRVTFSEPMHRTLTESAFSPTPATEGSFVWESDTLIFTPIVNLEANSPYTISITDEACDLGHNSLANVFTSTFETGSSKHTITASAGANGSINPSGTIVKNAGESQQFTATPNTYYAVDQWYLDDNPVQTGGNNYTLTDIQSDHTVYVTFKIIAPVVYVDDDAITGAQTGLSWPDAFTNLQDALSAAANSGGATKEIRVAQGTYKPDQGNGITIGDRGATFQLLDGVAVKGGYAGFGELNPNARDVDLYETILSGDLNGDDVGSMNDPSRSENSNHVITASTTDATAILDGVTITAGYANGNYPHNRGGGMFNNSGSPAITYCNFTGNFATSWGGGMYNLNGSSPVVTNCTFTDNVTGDHGGGVHNWDSSPVLTNCVFNGNSTGSWGGGIRNFYSDAMLTNCEFSNNTAGGYGGGIYNDRCSPTMTNCSFFGNSAGRHEGGATRNFYSSSVAINCIFSGNSAGDWGGGMSNYCCSPIVINCTFVGNVAWSGGGMYNDGLYNEYLCSPTIINCILWGNMDNGGRDESAQIHTANGIPIVTFSCIQDVNSEDGYIPFGGAANSNTDDEPIFVRDPDDGDDGWGDDLTTPSVDEGANDDYGDLHLLINSPCIDAGDNSALPEDIADLDGDGNTTEPTPWDLDGNPRIIGDEVDMGCYEYQVPGNQAPVLQAIGNKSVDENITLIFDVNATDPDGDPLIYSVQNLPSGATLDPQTGDFAWTPSYDQAGGYQVTFIASDGQAQDSETITITVNNVNRPPILSGGPVSPSSGDTGTDFYWYVNYYDTDVDLPDTKNVYIDGTSYIMSFYSGSESNGTYRYGPMNLGVGSHNYYFYFTDGQGGSAQLPSIGMFSGPSVSEVKTTVPNIVGMSQSDAESTITSAGLVVGTVTHAFNSTVPAGDIISQNPVGGTSVVLGSAVDLEVSDGPQIVTVPSVVGMSQSDAESAITSAGLTVGTITHAYSSTVPTGDIISQNPAGGASVIIGSAINLVISDGPQTVTVLFTDDFENVAVGDYPNENGWQMMTSGETAYVSDVQGGSGTRSFRLEGRANWSRCDYVQLNRADIEQGVTYEVSVYLLDAPQEGAYVGFGQLFGNQLPCNNKFSFGNHRVMAFVGEGPGVTFGNWEPNRWYRIRAEIDYTQCQADVYIDGSLVGENIPTKPIEFDDGLGHNVLDKFILVTPNWSPWTSAIDVVYFDDVRVVAGSTPPAYPNCDFCGPPGSDQPDGYVDYWDLLYFAQRWHSSPSDTNWDPRCDLDKEDNYVDYWDLLVFAQCWHKGVKP